MNWLDILILVTLVFSVIGGLMTGIVRGACNLAGLIIVSATLDVASVIVSEATLGLLGLSAQNPQTSLGKMIVEAFGYISLNWTQVLFPSLVLALFVLALSFVGDGLQEYVEHS